MSFLIVDSQVLLEQLFDPCRNDCDRKHLVRSLCGRVEHHTDLSTRSIMRDPGTFPNPELFSIDRWLDPHGKVSGELKVFGFGYGRR